MSYLLTVSIGFVALLYLSGTFSGSETAYFSLSKLDLGELAETSRVRRLMAKPERLLIAILVGNTLVNVAAGSLGALAALTLSSARNFHEEGLAIALEVGVVTFVILVAGEIAPKMYAMQRNVAFARRNARLLSATMRLLAPVVSGLSLLLEKLGGAESADRPFVTAEELRTIVALSEERGTLEEDERDMIHSVMEFGDTVVRELMVPRVDMQCLESRDTVGTAIDRVKELGYSRVPVYEGDVDHIVGILYAKDLLKFDSDADQDRPVTDIIRPPFFTPESKNAGDLLRELQRRRIHIAVVIDEYGGTAGIVTLEDLIEEIVGEIRDEHDREEPLLTVIDSRTLIADGMVRLDELAESMGLMFEEKEGVETLGGYLMDAFGRIPSVGEMLERDGAEFTIESVLDQRITSVRITRVEEPETAAEEGER